MDAYSRDPRRPALDWAHTVVLAGDMWDPPRQLDPDLALAERQWADRVEPCRHFGHSACVTVHPSPTLTPLLAIDHSMCRNIGFAHAAVAADGLSCLVGIRAGARLASMLVTMSAADTAEAGPVRMYASALYGWLVWQAEREHDERVRSWQNLPAALDLVEGATTTRVRLAGGPGPWGQWPVRYDKPAREQLDRPWLDLPHL